MNREGGFTLIELLITVAIIGILSVIAIPNYFALRANGYNAAAASDLRNLRTAADFASNKPSTVPTLYMLQPASGGLLPAGLEAGNSTVGVAGFVDVGAGDYSACAYHLQGTLCYCFDSDPAIGYEVSPGTCPGP